MKNTNTNINVNGKNIAIGAGVLLGIFAVGYGIRRFFGKKATVKTVTETSETTATMHEETAQPVSSAV